MSDLLFKTDDTMFFEVVESKKMDFIVKGWDIYLELKKSECDCQDIVDYRKGQVCKMYREHFDLKQWEVAKDFGCTESFVSRYEKGLTYSDSFWDYLLHRVQNPIDVIRWVYTGKNKKLERGEQNG